MDHQAVEKAGQHPIRVPMDVFELSLDDKARLKLPVSFHTFLKTQDNETYITTFDGRIARIYARSEWDKVAEFFQTVKEQPEAAERIWNRIQHFGGESGVDASGRLVLPVRLRELLGMTPKSKVWIKYNRGAFDLTSDAVYQANLALSATSPREDITTLRKAGMPG